MRVRALPDDFANADPRKGNDSVSSYREFLEGKAPRAIASGVEPTPMPPHLFDFQSDVTAFLIRQGRGAAFLDTGLGKTAIELEWCRQSAAASNGLALILTPLAVARQIEREAHRWGYDARVIRDQSEARPGINICNYDRFDRLRPSAFGAVALDESSILKNFNGATKKALIAAFSEHAFRLCATATPAPNDHMELGQHAEFLGVMPSNEMLARWFISDQTQMGRYRLKRHGEGSFWDWMASWSRCAETPADLGYDASRFTLPPLNIIKHHVAAGVLAPDGVLFIEAMSATEIHTVKRQTAEARAAKIAQIVAAEPDEIWVVWCDTDYEADALIAAIPTASEVRGSHPIERKESALAAFANRESRVLVTKPSVCGYGLNWQYAARVAFVGRMFSYESWYQAIRRCWRFGQTRTVNVHLAVAEGEGQISRVIERKAEDHTRMKREMAHAMKRDRRTESALKVSYEPKHEAGTPSWLQSDASTQSAAVRGPCTTEIALTCSPKSLTAA